VVGRQRRAVRRLHDRHRRDRRQQLDQQARVARVQMLHEDERDAGVGGHGGQQPLDGLETAGGRADPHHGQTVAGRTDAGRAVAGRTVAAAPRRRSALRLDRSAPAAGHGAPCTARLG
jgi:hypothetical protein